jgi:hypothetical protein
MQKYSSSLGRINEGSPMASKPHLLKSPSTSMAMDYEKGVMKGNAFKKPQINTFSGSPLGMASKALMPQTMVHANETNSR